jgi:putative ABC transport system permease protein
MSPSLWLARRELSSGRGRATLAIAVVAAAAALVTSVEVLARAREDAVATQVDALGPPIRILPSGVSPEAIARYDLGSSPLPPDTEPRVRSALGSDLRVLEARRALVVDVDGAATPVLSASSGARHVAPGTAALGSIASARLAGREGVAVGGEMLRIAEVLPASATSDDMAVYVSQETIERVGGGDAPNELRVFLAPGADARVAERTLAAALDARVLRSDRGEVADRALDSALARHRGAAYLVTAIVAALCLAIGAHLDAAERRVELATLLAIGATSPTLAGTLVARSVLVAGVGGVLGVSLGIAVAALLDPSVIQSLVRAGSAVASIFIGTTVVGAAAALPVALAGAVRDPIPDLQEG